MMLIASLRHHGLKQKLFRNFWRLLIDKQQLIAIKYQRTNPFIISSHWGLIYETTNDFNQAPGKYLCTTDIK